MVRVAALVRELLDRFDEILTYGSSMGGYAALRFANLLGATHALAFSPQFTIDPRHVPLDPRWQRHYRPEWHDNSQIRRKHVARHSYMVFDPYFPYDRWHADLIARRCRGSRRCASPFSEHLPILLTQGTQTTLGLFEACLEANTAGVVARVRAPRRLPLNVVACLRRRRSPSVRGGLARSTMSSIPTPPPSTSRAFTIRWLASPISSGISNMRRERSTRRSPCAPAMLDSRPCGSRSATRTSRRDSAGRRHCPGVG